MRRHREEIEETDDPATRRALALVTAVSVALTLGAAFLGGLGPFARSTDGDVAVGGVQIAATDLDAVLHTDDGAAPFDPAEGPGLDAADDNRIVRTNDRVHYDLEISVAAAGDLSFSMAVPRGIVIDDVPPYCDEGSSIDPATVPDPTLPLTASSWLDLPSQRLDCAVGGRDGASSVSYPLVGRVRPEVPNGSALDAPVVAVTTVRTDDGGAPLGDPIVREVVGDQLTVSAAARFNVSFNSTAATPDSGYLHRAGVTPCADGSGRSCYAYVLPLLVGATGDGIGASALDGGFRIVDDLSLEATYGADILTHPAIVAAGDDAAARYGAILDRCRGNNWRQPNGRLSAGDVTNSVRDSGRTTCSQPGGPGTPVDIVAEGVDTTLLTTPTHAGRPADAPFETGLGYVYSHAVVVHVPVEAARDLAPTNDDGERAAFRWTHRLGAFEAVALDGTPNAAEAQLPADDLRTVQQNLASTVRFDTWFVGVPGARGNVPRLEFNQGWALFEGPAGGTGTQAGTGQVMAGQPTIAMQMLGGTAGGSGEPTTLVGCETWDPRRLRLAAMDVPASADARAQALPSEGAPVWLSGRNIDRRYLSATNDVHRPDLTVHYGTGPATASCDDADSPAGWFADPADVPGNDPTLAAAGIYTAVSKVRIHAVLPPETVGVGNWAWVSMSMVAADDLPVGETVAVRANRASVLGEVTLDDFLAAGPDWVDSRYVPATNRGRAGDRLTIGGAIVRVESRARVGGDPLAAAVDASGGDDVVFEFAPTLSAASDFGAALPVGLEHCLPTGLSYVDSSTQPIVVALGAPDDAEIACADDETFLRWDLGAWLVNAELPTVELTARVSSLAAGGIRTASTLVASPADQSNPTVRTTAVDLDIVQPSGVNLEVTTPTPLIERNRPDETAPSPLEWTVALGRSGGSAVGDDDADALDLIIALPSDGSAGSAFAGRLDLTALSATHGTDEFDLLTVGGTDDPEVWVTTVATASLVLDPRASANALGGSSIWCRVDLVTCSPTGDGITAVRIRGGHALDDAPFVVAIEALPFANDEEDRYRLAAGARVDRLDLPLGPSAVDIEVVASSVVVTVFDDVAGDGLGGADDPRLVAHPVTLRGSDRDGNRLDLTVATDGDGVARFPGLVSGDYEVAPALLDGSIVTLRGAAVEGLVSHVDPLTGAVALALAPNTDVALGAGFTRPASIGGTVVDGHGVGLAGVEILVAGTDDTGAVSHTLRTDGAGEFTLGRLRPGTYVVTETQPAGYGDGGVELGPAARLLATDSVELLLGAGTAAEAGTFHDTFASLSGEVAWQAGGAEETAPVGIEGVAVTLVGADDAGTAVNRTVRTDADGRFEFGDLLGGDYDLIEAQPARFLDGPERVGTAGGVSDAAAGADRVRGIALAPGARAVGYAFIETGALIEGTVWSDTDADGVLDADERGRFGGVTIVLRAGTVEVARATTAADGTYLFRGVLPGDYTVDEEQPAGTGSTTPNRVSLTVGLDVVSGVHFGDNLGSVAGVAWDDSDGDGHRGGDEPVHPAIAVRLVDLDGAVVATTATDADGRYAFDGVPAGRYRVVPQVPASMTATVPVGADRSVDGPGTRGSDLDWISGHTAELDLSSASCGAPARGVCPPPLPAVADIDLGFVRAESDLAIVSSVPRGLAREGSSLAWGFTVTNVGETPQRNPEVRIDVPGELEVTSVSGDNWTCAIGDRTMTCRYNLHLLPGQTAPSLTLTTIVDVGSGLVEVSAGVSPGPDDIVEIAPSDNVSVAGVSVERTATALALTGAGPSVALVGLALLVAGVVFRTASRFSPARRS